MEAVGRGRGDFSACSWWAPIFRGLRVQGLRLRVYRKLLKGLDISNLPLVGWGWAGVGGGAALGMAGPGCACWLGPGCWAGLAGVG